MGRPAARVTDPHLCPMFDGPKPHVGGPVLPISACFTVQIGGLFAATRGTKATCVGPLDTIAQGSTTVFIGGKPAARQFDMTSHGGAVMMGCLTVLIGSGSGGPPPCVGGAKAGGAGGAKG